MFLFILFNYSVLLSEEAGDVTILYQKESAEDLALNIERENLFNELNKSLQMIYNNGVNYLRSGNISDITLKKNVELLMLEHVNDSKLQQLELEQLMYNTAGEIINQITAEFGEEKLLEYYPEEFLAAIAKPPVLLTRERLQTIIDYAQKNLSPGKQLSLKGSFKAKTPMIQDADLSGLDLKLISLKDIPIWNSSFERSEIIQNSLCVCGGNVNFTSSDISGSQIYRCKACDNRFEILKITPEDSSQKLLCKGVKAERAKFALNYDSSNSDFSYSNLRNSSWVGDSLLAGSNFHGVDLSGAFLERFNCNECDFTDVTLDAIKIIGFLNLIKADIEDKMVVEFAGLDKVMLTTTDLEKISSYSEANNIRHDITLLGQKYSYDLSAINLSNKYLKLVTNNKINLDNANFSNSIIEDSFISGSSMRDINFTGGKIRNSIIKGDISGWSVIGLEVDHKSKLEHIKPQ